MPAFGSLVPELDARVLPFPVMSVQVTRFGTGGLAIGLSMHHAVGDGCAMWRFMEAWACASREGSSVTKALGLPVYFRDLIHHPRAVEVARESLRIIASNLPVVSDSQSSHLLTTSWPCYISYHACTFALQVSTAERDLTS